MKIVKKLVMVVGLVVAMAGCVVSSNAIGQDAHKTEQISICSVESLGVGVLVGSFAVPALAYLAWKKCPPVSSLWSRFKLWNTKLDELPAKLDQKMGEYTKAIDEYRQNLTLDDVRPHLTVRNALLAACGLIMVNGVFVAAPFLLGAAYRYALRSQPSKIVLL